MDRNKALEVIQEHVKDPNIIKHMLAVEAVMRALSRRFDPSRERFWALAGLLHDGDYCEGVPVEKQGIQISEWIEGMGISLPRDIKHSVAAHNAATGVKPESKMAWSLFACDSLVGLIVASALVTPNELSPRSEDRGVELFPNENKKLADLRVPFVINRFNDKSFAKGTRREDILTCEKELGISLEDFVKICLRAMQDKAEELGL